MEQPYSYVLTNINQEPITKNIIKFVGDQSNPETKVENLRALLGRRRVNKQWKKYAEAEYARLFALENAWVEKHYKRATICRKDHYIDDWEEIKRSEVLDGKLLVALTHGLIVWLHHVVSKNHEITIELIGYPTTHHFPVARSADMQKECIELLVWLI